jgi:uncharacterized protein (DUF983 family)
MKRNTLLASLVMGALFFVMPLFISVWCGQYDYICQDSFEPFFSVALIFLPVLLFSLITYKMREEVSRAWIRLVYIWIPISIFLTLITHKSGGGWGVGISWEKGTTAALSSSLFFFISLIIIIYKYFAVRQKV